MTIKQHGGIFGRNPTFNEVGGTLTTAAQPNVTSLGTQTSNLAFASGNGIDFSATSDGSGTTTSELFNDYEEGTWTPVIQGASVAGAGTYTAQLGYYTKTGRSVYLSGRIAWNAHTGSGNMRLAGLPFTISSSTQSSGSAAVRGVMTVTGQPFVSASSGATHGLFQALNNGSLSLMTITASGDVVFQFLINT